MHEHIQMSAGSDLDLLGDETCSRSLESFHCMRQIGDMNGDVMQAFTALFQEPGNDRIGAGGFQQFNAAFTHWNHRHLDFFVLDCFFRRYCQTKLLVKLARRSQRFYGDAEMVNGEHSSWLPAKLCPWFLAFFLSVQSAVISGEIFASD